MVSNKVVEPLRYYLKSSVIVELLKADKDADMHPVEAMQFTGYGPKDINIYRWVEGVVGGFGSIDILSQTSGVSVDPSNGYMMLATKQGVAYITPGDWLIRHLLKGDFAKCDEETFKATYEHI